MKNKEVIELAIKRHDLDANWFQQQYDPNNNKVNLPFIYGRKLVLEELENLVESLPKGSRILDVGSGTGHLTQWLKEKGYEVKGIEPSGEMLEFAVKNFPEIEFKKGISSKIPFEDNHFDLIIAFEVLRYLNQEVNIETYKEFKRVLKNGGKFFVTHVNKYSLDFYYPFYFIKGLFYKAQKKTYHFCYFTTPSGEEQLIEYIGFKNIISIGRMNPVLRITYKLGSAIFNLGRKITEILIGKQRFSKNPWKALSGHLILIAEK